MRLIATLLSVVALASPAFAEECRYFSNVGGSSFTLAEQDFELILHTKDGDQFCEVDHLEGVSFSVWCDSVREVLYFPDATPGTDAFFRGKVWRWRCLEPT